MWPSKHLTHSLLPAAESRAATVLWETSYQMVNPRARKWVCPWPTRVLTLTSRGAGSLLSRKSRLWGPHTNVHASPCAVRLVLSCQPPPLWSRPECQKGSLRDLGHGWSGGCWSWLSGPRGSPKDRRPKAGRAFLRVWLPRLPYSQLITRSLSLPSPIIRITGLALGFAFLLMETLQFHVHYKGNSRLRVRCFAHKVWGPLMPPKGKGVVGSQTSVTGPDWPGIHFGPCFESHLYPERSDKMH